jgi:hypothetical protein
VYDDDCIYIYVGMMSSSDKHANEVTKKRMRTTDMKSVVTPAPKRRLRQHADILSSSYPANKLTFDAIVVKTPHTKRLLSACVRMPLIPRPMMRQQEHPVCPNALVMDEMEPNDKLILSQVYQNLSGDFVPFIKQIIENYHYIFPWLTGADINSLLDFDYAVIWMLLSHKPKLVLAIAELNTRVHLENLNTANNAERCVMFKSSNTRKPKLIIIDNVTNEEDAYYSKHGICEFIFENYDYFNIEEECIIELLDVADYIDKTSMNQGVHSQNMAIFLSSIFFSVVVSNMPKIGV